MTPLISANTIISDTAVSLQLSAGLQASAAVEAIANETKRCEFLYRALQALRLRCNLTGSPVDAAGIRKALAQGESLDMLFSADPSSLAGNLADAQTLAGDLERSRIDTDVQLLYPVLLSHTENGKTTESLIWMSAAQRTLLDRLPAASKTDMPGFPARVESAGKGGVTVYHCLDAYRTMRIPGSSMQQLAALVQARLQTSGEDMRRMVSDFVELSRCNEVGLADVLQLLKTVYREAEKRLARLHEEDLALSRDFQECLKEMERSHEDKKREFRRLTEREMAQREEQS